MPKFYLHRSGKIATAVHPFVKQTALPQDKHKPSLHQGKIIQDVQNMTMWMYRMIYIAIAPLAVGIASGGRLHHPMSKPLDRLK